jgi:hypothetical protein
MILSRNKYGTRMQCLECNAKRHKKYSKTDIGSVAVRKAVTTYERKRKNKGKRTAWWKAAKAIPLAGAKCSRCERTLNLVRHHPDYSKPLDVVIVCALHHKEIHREEKVLC